MALDYNAGRQDGIGMTQTTIRGGRRMSTAVCYLDPARSRPNLRRQANALTERLLFDGDVLMIEGWVSPNEIFKRWFDRVTRCDRTSGFVG
jgi:choline dehydrogenase-like flavoprotein